MLFGVRLRGGLWPTWRGRGLRRACGRLLRARGRAGPSALWRRGGGRSIELGVVGGARLVVFERLVSLRDLRERRFDPRALGGIGIALETIRVEAFGQRVIGAFDLARVGRARDAEHLIIVRAAHARQ